MVHQKRVAGVVGAIVEANRRGISPIDDRLDEVVRRREPRQGRREKSVWAVGVVLIFPHAGVVRCAAVPRCAGGRRDECYCTPAMRAPRLREAIVRCSIVPMGQLPFEVTETDTSLGNLESGRCASGPGFPTFYVSAGAQSVTRQFSWSTFLAYSSARITAWEMDGVAVDDPCVESRGGELGP